MQARASCVGPALEYSIYLVPPKVRDLSGLGVRALRDVKACQRARVVVEDRSSLKQT